MGRQTVTLEANKEQYLRVRGRVLQFIDLGAASDVTLQMQWGPDRQELENFGHVPRHFRLGPTLREFWGFTLLATVACTVDFLVSNDHLSGLSPMPTETTGNGGAEVASNPAAVAVTDAGVELLAANTSAKRVVLYNAGSNPVGISRVVGTTFANCAIVLAAGDTFIEERFAGTNQPFRGRCGTGLASTIAIEVTQ